MSRTELLIGLAIVSALVIPQWPGWAVKQVSNTDSAGITYLAQHSLSAPGGAVLMAKNDDPPPHKRDDPPRRGDDPPPHG